MLMTTRYSGLRTEMVRLRDEFERAAERTPGLYHDLLFTPKYLPASTAVWEDFIEKTGNAASWERWDIFPEGVRGQDNRREIRDS